MTGYAEKKARRGTSPFMGIRKDILKSPHFRSLTGTETKVFLHLYGEYNGSNNGYLALPYNKADEDLNISRQRLSRALKGLEVKGWIEKSRQGGKGHLSYYAVTIEPIDEVLKNGLSVHNLAPTKTASHKWRNYPVK
ncbi:helix-turn-helix domain-containing protein [Aggregatibacter segnis]|uniref:helix-turn-helix domain-containing protein n=1 Tax=Aggregatibacter segnis TaxID=739 RepID=UPI000D64A7B3|nr:helix-turn-helix domain-containing protein [Aggregatibacter segnis]